MMFHIGLRASILLYFVGFFDVSICKAEHTGHHIEDHIDHHASRVKHRNGVHRTDIYFAAFFPMGGKTKAPEESIGRGVMPAVKLAIKHINQSPNILRGYKLHMYWNDTECNPGVGLKAFFDMVHIDPKKLILFGAACSPVTDQIARAAKHWNLVQITYADTHPMFTDKSFPHFFRVVPSDNEFNPPRLSIMRNFNWTRVGTLYQNEAKYALAHNDLVSNLMNNNFSIVESQSFNDEITEQLEILDKKDVRIILGNFNETWARKIFCEAYRRKMDGKKFQWLIVGMYEEKWWEKGSEETECTAAEIQHALVGTMVLDILPLASNEDITISRRTPGEYNNEYSNVTKHRKYSRYHGYAYDGIWAAALAINEVIHRAKYHMNATLADFTYRSDDWEKLFIDALDKTSFEGVTGPVRFKDNSRRGNVVIKQMVPDQHEANTGRNDENGIAKRSLLEGVKEQCIGEYSGVTRTLYLEQRYTRCESGSGKVYWAGERPPRDQTIVRIEDSRVNIAIYVGLTIVASFGIILAVVFLAINIKFRNQRQIKMSSPNMNNLIITGCILSYTSVIVLGLDSHITSIEAFPYICTARAWMVMWGFTLSFGSMFSKTWRVHSIFTNVQINKKVMKDTQLYLIIGIMICVDLIVMTAWQIFDPFYRETKELTPYDLDHQGGVRIIPRIESCKSDYMTVFVGCIYAYKGLLMLFGAFLAWETRAVQIPALNDSKYVGMAIYNVAVMCVLGVAVSFVLQDELNASFILIAIFIIFCTTGTLCLVFVPKLIDLRRDPYGTMDQKKTTIKTNVAKKTPLQTMEDKLRVANNVNKKYESLLNDLEKDYKEACNELGPEEVAALLEKKPEQKTNAVIDTRKDARVSFAIDVNDVSSSCSVPTSSQNDSSGARKTEITETTQGNSSNNGKPTINPENNLLAAPGSIQANSQQKLVKKLPTQCNGQPQQLSHNDPTKSQEHDHKIGIVKLSGEVLVGQSPLPRIQTLEGQQLPSSSSSIIHDHPSGARPSTSSTISSDHFSSEYYSSHTSHDCQHMEQVHLLTQGVDFANSGCLMIQANKQFPDQEPILEESCQHLMKPVSVERQKQNTQKRLAGGKEQIHYIPGNISQYHHPQQHQSCEHRAQYECQQRAADKLCDHLSQSYESRDHSGEFSNSEYTDEEEEDDAQRYTEDGCERRMITIQQSSQNQSILKPTMTHSHGYHTSEGGGAGGGGHYGLETGSQNESFSSQPITKTQKACQTYYEDHATQTEDEEEDDEICHKHGCKYRRIQTNTHDDTTIISGPEYPRRRRSQELSPSAEDMWTSLQNPSVGYPNSNHNSLHYPKSGNSKSNGNNIQHQISLLQATSVDDTNALPTAHLTMSDIQRMGISCNYGIISQDKQLSGGGEKSFSTSHDEIAYRGTNVESSEILPIFHKLLEDKRSSHNELDNSEDPVGKGKIVCDGNPISMEHTLRNSTSRTSVQNNGRKAHFNAASAKMRSCPDMSVRCDIVEYL